MISARGRRRTLLGALLAAVLLGTASLGAAQTEPLLRVGLGPEDDSKPLVYAAQSGLFARAGLNVQLNNLAGSAVIAAALAGGSLEIGKGSPVGVITAHAKGLPFEIIGGSARYTSSNPQLALVAFGSSGIRDARDLAGKTVGAVTLQDLGTLATLAWLDQHGVDRSALKFVELSASRALPSMESNRIDAMPLYEPTLSADLATGEVRVVGYPFDAIGKRFAMGVLFANTSWVDGHRDVVERFLRVMRQADAYVATHELETVPLLAQFSGTDPARLTKIHHAERTVAIGPADLQPIVDILSRYGVIPQAFRADELLCSCAPRT